jgi:hypothetical protein
MQSQCREKVVSLFNHMYKFEKTIFGKTRLGLGGGPRFSLEDEDITSDSNIDRLIKVWNGFHCLRSDIDLKTQEPNFESLLNQVALSIEDFVKEHEMDFIFCAKSFNKDNSSHDKEIARECFNTAHAVLRNDIQKLLVIEIRETSAQACLSNTLTSSIMDSLYAARA